MTTIITIATMTSEPIDVNYEKTLKEGKYICVATPSKKDLTYRIESCKLLK